MKTSFALVSFALLVMGGWLASASLRAQTPQAAAPAETAGHPIKALLILGGGYHDYNVQKDILKQGLEARGNIEVTIAYDTNTAEDARNPAYAMADWADAYDVIIHDECTTSLRDMDFINKVLKPHQEGKPALVLHCAMHSFRTEGWNSGNQEQATPWFELTGLMTTGHGAQLPISVIHADPENPITKGLEDWTTINEELYNNNGGLLPTATALARGRQAVQARGGRRGGRRGRGGPGGAAPADPNAQAEEPAYTETIVTWTNMYHENTRVFGTTLGHNNATVADPHYLDLVARGLLWAVGRDIDAEFKKPDEATDQRIRDLAMTQLEDGSYVYLESNCCGVLEEADAQVAIHPADR